MNEHNENETNEIKETQSEGNESPTPDEPVELQSNKSVENEETQGLDKETQETKTPPPVQEARETNRQTPPPLPKKESFEESYNEYTFNQKNNQRKKKKSNVPLIIAVIVISLVVGLGGGYVGSMLHEKTVSRKNTVNNVINTSDVSTVAGAVSKVASPSVVEIQTESLKKGGYFGQYTTQGAGSGVIYTEDGYIITNNHVIDGASNIQVFVKTADNPTGEAYKAKLIGTDAKNDLAVLKIEANDLTPAKIGKSSELQLGDFVLAIGNPLGSLGGTVTDGIVSALDREIEVEGSTMRLLQTNAAVNPGNSGGGLFNSNGELVGIVSAKSSGDDVEGLGFAIPVDTATPIVDEIIATGGSGTSETESQKVQLGVSIRQTESGILVVDVEEDSPAYDAGFKAGDIIVGTKEARLRSVDDLSKEMSRFKTGDQVSFKVIRDGDTKTLDVQF